MLKREIISAAKTLEALEVKGKGAPSVFLVGRIKGMDRHAPLSDLARGDCLSLARARAEVKGWKVAAVLRPSDLAGSYVFEGDVGFLDPEGVAFRPAYSTQIFRPEGIVMRSLQWVDAYGEIHPNFGSALRASVAAEALRS